MTVRATTVALPGSKRGRDIPLRQPGASALIHQLAVIAGIFASLSILLRGNETPAAIPYFVLPLVYSILGIVFPTMLRRCLSSVGMAVINVVVAFKFVVGPVFWSGTAANGLVASAFATPGARSQSFWLMLAELVTVSFVIHCFAAQVYSRELRREPASQRSNLLLGLFLALGIATFVLYPTLTSRYNFFIVSSLEEADLGLLPLGGLAILITDLVLVIAPVLLLTQFKKKYDLDQAARWVVLSFIAVLPVMLVFRGTSRLSVLIPTLAWLVVLIHLYPRWRRRLIAVVLLVSVTVFVVISLFKQFGYSLTEEAATASNPAPAQVQVARTMNAYFSGPENIALGVDMFDSNEQSFSTFTLFNDLARNTVGLASLSDPGTTTVVRFNELIYGVRGTTDQIVPLVVQSRTYFGPGGSTLLLGIATYLMMRFDRRAQVEPRIEYKYAFVYVTVYLSLGVMTSAGSIFPVLTNFLAPLLIIFALNNFLGSSPTSRPLTRTSERFDERRASF